jgi:hypothetical protein
MLHHDDVPGEGHGLDLVVGHVDRGRAQAPVQLGDLRAHLNAELRVEVGQGLVEQEDRGLAHDRAPHGDPLALAAGQLLRLAIEELLEPEDPRRLLARAYRSRSLGILRSRRPKLMLS